MRTYDKAVLGWLILVTSLLIYIITINNKADRDMDIYLCKYATASNDVDAIEQELPNLNIVQYNGGPYDRTYAPILACDKLLLVLPDKGVDVIIGRGQYGELNAAANGGLTHKAIFVDPLGEGSVYVYEIEDATVIDDGKDWKQYAQLDLTYLATYQLRAGTFEDYVQNF